MWFRNLRIYRFVEPMVESPDDLEECLTNKPLHPCGKTQPESVGWVSPFGLQQETRVHVANGYWRICCAKQQRLLPASVIKEHLEDKIREVEEKEFRTVFKKEKSILKEDIVFDLLPKAFTKNTFTYAYIDTRKQLLIIDTASANTAEWFINQLRDAVGHCQLVPLETKSSVMDGLTNWVTNGPPTPVELEDSCLLVDTKTEGASIKVNKLDISHESILQHIKQGKMVTQLSACFDELMSFQVTHEMVIKSIKPLTILQERRKETEAEDMFEQQDAEFSLMVLEFDNMLSQLVKAMGGIKQLKKAEKRELEPA